MSESRPGSSSTRRLRARQRFVAWLRRLLARLVVAIDRARWAIRRRWGRVGPLQILAYRGFGTLDRVILDGRVIETKPMTRPTPVDSGLQNLMRTWRLFRTREIPGAQLRARLGPAVTEADTDQEGYYHLALRPEVLPVDGDGWHPAEVELTGCPVRGWRPITASAEVLVPGPRAAIGIVSDIDDTVLQTYVTRRLKMIWLTMVQNAYTRLPFEGTSELYRALAAGASGAAANPVFYVSKSPWNLYDFLIEFMDRHGLPRGPLLLRELGLHDEAPLDFKAACLERIFDTYPRLPFVLIGDSGERDPDLYLDFASHHPGRVKAIYIRDVGSGPLRRRQLDAMPAEARRLGCEMLLVSHAHEALAHARQVGLAAR
jgi:phosphatidate phosphatase APP1